ncbi:MAG: hypothetical protein ABI832_16730 [bacterium]
MNVAAILTGDLIGSTLASNEALVGAMDSLAAAAETLSKWYGYNTRFTRFRGDGWQVYLDSPNHILRATLLLWASLRRSGCGLDTRLSIGVGAVEQMGGTELSGATGAAFTLSGRNLDRMGAYQTFTYADLTGHDQWPRAVLDLASWQAGHWSREQAEAVALALPADRPTDTELATGLGISRQALQSRLKGSGLAAMGSALMAFEQFYPAAEPNR